MTLKFSLFTQLLCVGGSVNQLFLCTAPVSGHCSAPEAPLCSMGPVPLELCHGTAASGGNDGLCPETTYYSGFS